MQTLDPRERQPCAHVRERSSILGHAQIQMLLDMVSKCPRDYLGQANQISLMHI